MKPNWHYYEAHITLEDTDRPEDLQSLLTDLGIKVVDLVNIPLDGLLNEEGIITTLHSNRLDLLKDRVVYSVQALQSNGYKVLRYKIESTIFDSKHHDKFQLL